MTTTEAPTAPDPLTRRDRAILKAVDDGRAQLVHGTELLLDGRCCCDQLAAHRLTRAGLIAPLLRVPGDQPVPARLTATGRARLTN